jgi:glycerol-3-phosphate acyltransferase PlsX
MWLAIDAVKKKEADMVVSAGNTGALMAMSKFELKMLAGIERPAIAALWPTLRGESIVLDVGASIGAEAEHLVDLAVMGAATARILFGIDRPTVGLLNIGVEEVKGLEPVREAGRILRERQLPDLDYMGFVEGDDIGMGRVDVVVTEGFAGNIALKTAEGTARQVGEYLRSAMSRSLGARIGYLFARSAFREVRERMDPRRVNGGVFLGLNGIVIKSHGSTDAKGFAAAIELGYGVVRDELLSKITAALGRPGREPQQALSGAASFRCPWLRQLSAEPGPHQRRSRAQARHHRRMDRAAHRHPRTPHRRARRADLAHGRARGPRSARARAYRCAGDRPHRARDFDTR